MSRKGGHQKLSATGPRINNRTIFTGDNLEVMRGLVDESIELIYLDPPFNSKHDYAAPIGSKAAGAAFKDTWTLNDIDVAWWGQIAKINHPLYQALNSAGYTSGNSAKSYLIYMAIRILEMHRILKPTGSIYLHCDTTMSHYLKLIMDAIFGSKNFRNEITWKRATSMSKIIHQNGSKSWGASTDIILFYGKNNSMYVKPYRKLSKGEIPVKFPNIDENGKRWKDDSAHIWNTPGMGSRPNQCYTWKGFTNPHPSGWRLTKPRLEMEYKRGNIVIKDNGKLERRIYLKDYRGVQVGNLWDDILPAAGVEKIGYPTQKPLALLERIIESSTNVGDMVLDPFCGCATACHAAERLKRKWIGIDISEKAAELIRLRLNQDIHISQSGGVIHRTDLPKRKGVLTREIKCVLYGTQAGKCKGCGQWFRYENLEVDHITPTSKGGINADSNLQLLCGFCNRTKGDRDMAYLASRLKELGMK